MTAEHQVFGFDNGPHPVTGMFLENGIGALPKVMQFSQHISVIAQDRGPDVARAISARLEDAEPEWKAQMDRQRALAAEAADKAAADVAQAERVAEALALLAEKEAADKAAATKSPAPAPAPAAPSGGPTISTTGQT